MKTSNIMAAVTAIHESGHAIIHHLVGNRVTYITIRPSKQSLGHVIVGRYEPTPAEKARGDWSCYTNYIIGCFAGYWAAMLFTPYSGIGCQSDFADINRVLRLISKDSSKRRKLHARLKEQSRRLVLKNEAHIRKVARVLLREQHIGNWRYADCNHDTSNRLDKIIGKRKSRRNSKPATKGRAA